MESSKKRKMLEEVFSDVTEPADEYLEGVDMPEDVTTHNIKTEKTIVESLKRKQNEIAMLTEKLILDDQQKAEQIERIHGLWKSEVHVLKEEKKQSNVIIKNMFEKVENKDIENAKLDDNIKNKEAMISELQHVLAQKEKRCLESENINYQLAETVKNLEHDLEALKKDGRDKQAVRLEAENLYISELESKISKLEDKSNIDKAVVKEKEKIITESSIKLVEFEQIISGMKLAEKEQNEAISNLNISLQVKYQEETKFKDKLNDQQKQFTTQYIDQYETLNSHNMATQLELKNQNTMLEQKFKTCTDKMNDDFETELNYVKERNKITMDRLLHETEAVAEVAAKNENLKTIITEKEHQVTNLQTTIESLQTQTDHIHNKIIRFMGVQAIVNADLNLYEMMYANFEKLSKVNTDKLGEKDKLIEKLQAMQDQANQPALFRKLAEKMGESYESGQDI